MRASSREKLICLHANNRRPDPHAYTRRMVIAFVIRSLSRITVNIAIPTKSISVF